MLLPSGSLLQVLRAESKADADSLLQALAHIDSLGACIYFLGVAVATCTRVASA